MSNGYFNYENLDSFLNNKKKINNNNIRIINEDQKKFKIKIIDEKKPLDNINKEKINKENKNILMKKRKMEKKKILQTPIKQIISLKL